MIRYKTVAATVPANGETTVTALTVPAGAKYNLKLLSTDGSNADMVSLIVNDTTFAEIQNSNTLADTYGLPLDTELDGPTELDIKVKDVTGSSNTVYATIAYKET